MSENFALERYVPPHQLEDRDDGVKNAVKLLAEQRPEALAESALATENLHVMIRHTTIDSMEEMIGSFANWRAYAICCAMRVPA
jgi:hypothetical protein